MLAMRKPRRDASGLPGAPPRPHRQSRLDRPRRGTRRSAPAVVLHRWAHRARPAREGFAAGDLSSVAKAQLDRGLLRLSGTAVPALQHGDVDGVYAAAYDGYRMGAEALLARQELRATGSEGSQMSVEDAVSCQFADVIPEIAKPTFERLRRTRHSAQYFDPDAPPITKADAEWAIEKARAALAGVKALLFTAQPERFK